ncbi:MAG: nucleoside triphosphate pyrophosphohydrolase [Bacteroidales bacterium]|jgi:XTP/dITP diphosphohydrolase|nr:nucleoside triphosphate pyrophosphohydrolase [Bacteroidales bacterium]
MNSKFDELLDIMDKLRAGCPWDKAQTLESLRYLTIEETYELSDAIINNDLDEIKKELGDLLLHVVFYAKIGEEKNAFTIDDVLDNINQKLISRHPHIFSDTKAETSDQVKANWEAIKLKEKGRKSVLEGVPKSLPAMVKAYRIQEKARGVGFDWDNAHQVLEKVIEEFREMQHEVKSGGSHERIEAEFGDLMFALINYARFINVNPDDALERTNQRFIKRFNYLEEQTIQKGKSLHDMTLDEMNVYWDQAKENERK